MNDNMNTIMNTNIISYFSNGSPVYFDIKVSGTPTFIEDNLYYGEINYTDPKTGERVIVWFSYVFKSSMEAFAECYRRMQEYIKENPIIEL